MTSLQWFVGADAIMALLVLAIMSGGGPDPIPLHQRRS